MQTQIKLAAYAEASGALESCRFNLQQFRDHKKDPDKGIRYLEIIEQRLDRIREDLKLIGIE